MNPGEVHVIWKTARHVFVWRDDLIVQIRGEAHSIEALDAQETGLRLARAQHHADAFGALLVIQQDAPMPMGEVAKRQRALVNDFVTDERVRIALVLEGEGTFVSLKRTIARGLFRGERRAICSSVREGARWLAAELGDPRRQEEIVAFAESLRTWK